jgi:hypothetical protein
VRQSRSSGWQCWFSSKAGRESGRRKSSQLRVQEKSMAALERQKPALSQKLAFDKSRKEKIVEGM